MPGGGPTSEAPLAINPIGSRPYLDQANATCRAGNAQFVAIGVPPGGDFYGHADMLQQRLGVYQDELAKLRAIPPPPSSADASRVSGIYHMMDGVVAAGNQAVAADQANDATGMDAALDQADNAGNNANDALESAGFFDCSDQYLA